MTSLRFADEGIFELYLWKVSSKRRRERFLRARATGGSIHTQEEDVVEYCQGLTQFGTIVTDKVPDVRGVVRDPNDDMIVACALAARAGYIVTRDNDLLSLGEYERIVMIKPEAFLDVLRAQTRT